MEDITYNVHYIYDDQENLDCLFISHDKTCFAPEDQIITLNMKQFESFIKTVKDVDVQWGTDLLMPSQIREWQANKDKGEYFADHDEVTDYWCVFHTDIKTGHAYASFSTQDQAEENAAQRNVK